MRVVQNNVGGDLLAPRLIPAPRPQTLKELDIEGSGGSVGSSVWFLRDKGAVRDRDTRLGSRGSAFREGCEPVGLPETYIAAAAGGDLLRVAEVPEQVLSATGFEGGVGFDGSDLVVGRACTTLEPGSDGPATRPIKALFFKSDVYERAAGNDLHEPIHHELEKSR